jgi:hypothetical protein
MLSVHRPELSCSSHNSADEDFLLLGYEAVHILYQYQCFGGVYFLHLQGSQRGVSCTVNTEHCLEKKTRNVVRLVGEHEWHCAVGCRRRWNAQENEERAGVWQLIEC